MSNLESLDRVATPLHDRVLRLLEREVVELRLRPGQRLLEHELPKGLGRVLREAKVAVDGDRPRELD